MKTNNIEIRIAMMKREMPFYKLAEIMRISESTLYRKLRYELTKNEKKEFLNAIENYKE